MKTNKTNVRDNLLRSAAELFLESDFHNVSTREIATHAGTTSAMINYYFKSKHGLFEEMIKFQYAKFTTIVINATMEMEPFDYVVFFKKLQALYAEYPAMAKFMMKITPLSTGPGSQYIRDMSEMTKQMMAARGKELKEQGVIGQDVDFEVVRIICMCLTLLPGFLQDTFKASYGEDGYIEFQDTFARFAGNMLAAAVQPKAASEQGCNKESNEEPAVI